MAWFSLVKAARTLSVAILTGTTTAGRTEVIEKEDRIIPVDHVADTRPCTGPERVEEPHVGIAKYYIGSLNGDLETVGVRSGKTMRARAVLTPGPDDAPTPNATALTVVSLHCISASAPARARATVRCCLPARRYTARHNSGSAGHSPAGPTALPL